MHQPPHLLGGGREVFTSHDPVDGLGRAQVVARHQELGADQQEVPAGKHREDRVDEDQQREQYESQQ